MSSEICDRPLKVGLRVPGLLMRASRGITDGVGTIVCGTR